MSVYSCPNATALLLSCRKYSHGTAETHAAPICCISACWQLVKTNWRVILLGFIGVQIWAYSEGWFDTVSRLFTCNVLLFLLSLLFEILQFPHGVCSRYCYPWDLGQTARGGPSKRGVPTVQQKLPVVDDAGACVEKWKKNIGFDL